MLIPWIVFNIGVSISFMVVCILLVASLCFLALKSYIFLGVFWIYKSSQVSTLAQVF